MKIVVLYRPNSEYARRSEEFIHDFQKRSAAHRVEVINPDTREGTAMADLYGVVDYPTILAVSDDGQVLKDWQGQEFPLMDEVASYAQ